MASFSTTPLALDTYARFGLDSFDERGVVGISTVWQSLYGRPASSGRTLWSPDSVVQDIDIIRANEKLAALVHRGSKGRDLGTGQKDTTQERFTTISRTYPLIEEEGNIDADQLLFRKAGESPISSMTRADRMRSHASDHHQEHVRRMVRTMEVMASQATRTGKLDAILGTSDTKLQYDFLRNATHTFTPTPKWDNASAVILDDHDTAGDLIRTNGHATMDFGIYGEGAMRAVVNDSEVRALSDNRRFELIQVSLTNPVPANLAFLVEAGATPRGRIQTASGRQVWAFTYLDVYTDDAGNPQKYMPDDEVLFGASSARCDRYFGPPERLPVWPQQEQLYQELFGFAPGMAPMPPNIKNVGGVIVPQAFYFDAYTSADGKRVTIRSQSAPIFAPTQTDGFVRLTSVLT